MEMIVDFPGGARVDAHFLDFTVRTDQPLAGGGENSAPSPFSLFLASLATCAGFYVLDFCRHRGIATEGLRVIQRSDRNRQTGMVEKVEIEIQLPPGFPERYRDAVIRSAEQCAVKKHLEHPPTFSITANVPEYADR